MSGSVKRLTIEPFAPVSLRAPSAIFLGAFGALWLILEPASSFGLIPPLSALGGLIGYAALVAVAIVATRLLMPLYRRQQQAKVDYIEFSVVAASDGAEHFVRSPSHMRVDDFLHQFLDALAKGPGSNVVNALRRTHEPRLCRIDSSGTTTLDSNQSLASAGITNGARCEIEAVAIERRVMYSRRAKSD